MHELGNPLTDVMMRRVKNFDSFAEVIHGKESNYLNTIV